MKIFVIGTRGIPDVPGGVEKHCQELYPRIVEHRHEVILCTRSPYIQNKTATFKGVKLLHVFAPRIKSFEAIINTVLALLKARLHHPDIVHIHAIGPSIMIPLARLLGLKVIMTHHGPDYDRKKWGSAARLILKAGESIGGRFANEVIVISRVIESILLKRCRRRSNLIYNGVTIPVKSVSTSHIDRIGVMVGKYILAVARLVPEKGLHDLINAFSQVPGDVKLVIAGDTDHETTYSMRLKTSAGTYDRVVMTGYIIGEYLNQLYSHAALFVLPSYHEGLPIALLEAMSYGLPPIVSDIPANREVGLDPKYYFPCGDVEALKKKLALFYSHPVDEFEKIELQKLVARKYNWNSITQKTIDVYRKVVNRQINIKYKSNVSKDENM